MASATVTAWSTLATADPGGLGMPTWERKSSNRWRSEATSIECAVEPRIGRPAPASDWERLMAVCPPNCTTDGGTDSSPPSSRVSFSRTSRTLSWSSGSK